MDTSIVILHEPEVNPLPPREIYRTPPRSAVRLYEPTRRAIILCHGCGNVCRGQKVHRWKFCPFCGAEVQR